MTTTLQFDGRLVLAGEAGFEAARVDRIFNRRLATRQPAAVLKVASEQDIVNGVRLAKERGWKVAVRAGGHSWAQWSVRDEALVLDLGDYHELGYDPDTQIATASPSTKGGLELSPFLAERGRFFPGGHCPPVGIGGFLIQGGQGWWQRTLGWGCEWVEAVDLVTAEGELIHASATENTDYYWAVRGAGPGFFGVVTRFHLRTMPVPAALYNTVQIFRHEDWADVLTWWHEIGPKLPPMVEAVAVCKMNRELSDEPVVILTGLAGVADEAEAREKLAIYATNPHLHKALVDAHCQQTTFEKERARQIEDNPEGHRWVCDNAWLDGSADAVVPALERAYTTLPGEKAFTIWMHCTDGRNLREDMAFSLESPIYVASYVPWEDTEDADDQHYRDWVDRVFADLEPVTVGQYLGDGDLSHRQVRFMSDENWARYLRLKAVHDPDDRFVGYLAGENGPTNRNHWER